jgi:hypothetical protein
VKLPVTEDGADYSLLLPVEASRASKVLGFDATGNVTAVANVPTSGVSATAFAETLLDDANAAAARTTLGFGASGAFIVAGDIASDAVTTAKILAANVTGVKIAEAVYDATVVWGGTSGTSSGTTYTATPSPAFTSYVAGMTIKFKTDAQNTGASTINVNSLGAKGLKDKEGSALVGGELKSGSIYTATYDGTNFLTDGVLAPSSVLVTGAGAGAAGHGSTNTRIRRFVTTVTSVGASITYADSAANGGSFTINKAGVYSIHYKDRSSTDCRFGVSLNSAQLTTHIESITNANRLVNTQGPTATIQECSVTASLASGDVIRAHDNNASDVTPDDQVGFYITRVA